jgi:hypothetical protein
MTAVVTVVSCSAGDEELRDHHDDGRVESVSFALEKNDPVSTAVTQSCTTASVRGLSTQLISEIQCLRPETAYKRLDDLGGVELGAAFPMIQGPVADALVRAQKARKTSLHINSALRSLPDQYILYRWYQLGRCGISLAAKPGTSNHESGLAVDVEDNSGWRPAMQKAGFTWLGESDPVHFDFKGEGTIDLRGVSVLAFQRLWNRNHPDDRIEEDGKYGKDTETRLAKSPVGGFPIGAAKECPKPDGTGATEPSSMRPGDSTPPTSETPEPEETPAEPAAPHEAASRSTVGRPSVGAEAGCSFAHGGGLGGAGVGFGVVALLRALRSARVARDGRRKR